MRTIRYTSRFKRDYKCEKKGRHAKSLDVVLREVTRIWRIDKVFAPTHVSPAHKLASEVIHLRVYFSLEEDPALSAQALLAPLLPDYYKGPASKSWSATWTD